MIKTSLDCDCLYIIKIDVLSRTNLSFNTSWAWLIPHLLGRHIFLTFCICSYLITSL
jgi:hypothetical protein